jgi:hypothetical protein
MADQAEEQGQPVVQSFSSNLETGIKVRNHAQNIYDRVVDRRIKFIFSGAFALLCIAGFGIASYGVIWRGDAKVREAMATNVWTPLLAIAGLLAGMALK